MPKIKKKKKKEKEIFLKIIKKLCIKNAILKVFTLTQIDKNTFGMKFL